jgi:hypothetical protein
MGFERVIVDLVEIEGVTEAENEQGVGEMCFFFPRVCLVGSIYIILLLLIYLFYFIFPYNGTVCFNMPWQTSSIYFVLVMVTT